MNLNKVIIAGRICKEPESRTVGESMVARFSVAVNEKWKDKQGNPKESTTFFDCEAWGGQAKFITTYIRKGQTVLVEAKYQTDTYEKDGQKKYKNFFRVEKIESVRTTHQEDKPKESNDNLYGGTAEGTDQDVPF